MKLGMNLLLWTDGVTEEHFPLLAQIKVEFGIRQASRCGAAGFRRGDLSFVKTNFRICRERGGHELGDGDGRLLLSSLD